MPVYAQGSIAGVNLTSGGEHCKTLILDGDNFFPSHAGATQFAADGEPHTQIMAVTKGIAFGVKLEFCPIALLASLKAAINTALSTSTPFNITLADNVHSINTNCFPDFSKEFISYPEQRLTTVIKDVILRFITV